MSPYDHTGTLTHREVRRSLPASVLIAAVLFVLAVLSVLAPPPPAPEGAAMSVPARTLEDWRGNSARITILPAE